MAEKKLIGGPNDGMELGPEHSGMRVIHVPDKKDVCNVHYYVRDEKGEYHYHTDFQTESVVQRLKNEQEAARQSG